MRLIATNLLTCYFLVFSILWPTVVPRAIQKKRSGKSFRYFKIACASSNISCIDPFCYIKNTRTDSTFSAGCKHLNKIYKVNVSSLLWYESDSTLQIFQYLISVSYRYLTNYRHIFSFPKVELCYFANLTQKTEAGLPLPSIFNNTFSWDWALPLIQQMKEMYPEKVHPCPFEGLEFQFYNFSSSNKMDIEKSLPSGDYRYQHTFFNDEDSLMFQTTVYEKFITGENSFF